jgi:hypothetical protein
VIINTEEDSWPKEERPQKKKTMKPNLWYLKPPKSIRSLLVMEILQQQ